MAEEWIDVVTLYDEEDKPVRFDHLLTFKHEDKTYIAMMAIDEVDGVSDDEVLLMEVVEEGTEDKYLPITNEVLLQEVFQTFLELFDELIDSEDGPEEEDEE